MTKLLHWALIIAACANACAEEAPAERRYDAGPLTADDFQADAPDPLPKLGRLTQMAFADSDIHFQMKYRYRNTRDGVEASLTEIDFYGVFLVEKSWLSRNDAKLIDHEQGHFDITQLHALEARLNMQRQLDEGKTLVGRGEDVPAAAGDLTQQVRGWLKPTAERTAAAHREYDRVTSHGTSAGPQAAQRKRHLEVLSELVKELNADDSEDAQP